MLNKYQLAIISILLLVALSLAYWWRAATKAEAQARTAISALVQQGWRIEFGEIEVGGAPMRLNLEFTAPQLASGDNAFAWDAETAQIRRLIYRGDALQLHAAGRQSLRTPLGEQRFTGQRAAASLSFGADGYAEPLLSRLSAVLVDIEGEGFAATRFEAHLGATPEPEEARRRLYLGATALRLGSAKPLNLAISGHALFDRPLSRREGGVPELIELALDPTHPQGGKATLSRAEDGEDEPLLTLSGKLERQAGSDPLLGWRGTLAFKSDRAEQAIALLAEIGLLDAASASRLRDRIARSGRLAGVLAINGARVEALDIAPQSIPLRAR